MHQIRFRLGLCPRPAGGAYRPLAAFKGPRRGNERGTEKREPPVLFHKSDTAGDRMFSGGARVFAARGKRLCYRPRQSDQFCNQGISHKNKNEKWFIAYGSSMVDYTWNIKTLKGFKVMGFEPILGDPLLFHPLTSPFPLFHAPLLPFPQN